VIVEASTTGAHDVVAIGLCFLPPDPKGNPEPALEDVAGSAVLEIPGDAGVPDAEISRRPAR
jgi:hypothetical protein